MKYGFLILLTTVLLISTQLVSAESLNIKGNINIPTYSNGIVTDHNGNEYSIQADGIYKIEYDIQKVLGIKISSKITYLVFGINGEYNNGNSFNKLTNDYNWNISTTTLGNKITSISTTQNNEWKTKFEFTPTKTKITNEVTNDLNYQINNSNFYYLFTLDKEDIIDINTEKGKSKDKQKNVKINNKKIPYFSINDNLLFDYNDIITSGYNVTDIHIKNAIDIGFSNYNKDVIALQFHKNNLIIKPQDTIIFDPSIEQVGGTLTLWGNHTYDYVNLSGGAILYIGSYNGTADSGMLNLTILYDLNIDSTSSINANSRGFTGGASNAGGGLGGMIVGNGGGSDGGGSSFNGGGGGGGYGTIGGGGGCSSQFYGGGCQAGGTGGIIKGTTYGQNIEMGSGAGSGGGAQTCTSCGLGPGGAGENGGGVINIKANRIFVSGTITSNGGVGGWGRTVEGSSGAGSGGGGGGAAGGGIKLNASLINISGATITTTGGAGGSPGSGAVAGGTGGGGRIKLFYTTLFNMSTTITTGSIFYSNIPPTITFPTNNSYQNNATLNITWSMNNQPTTIISNWQLSTSSDFSTISLQGNVTNNTYSNTISPASNTLYYLRINTNIDETISSWSNTVTFYHVSNYINATLPINASTVSNTLVTLKWTETEQSTPSTFYLATNNNFSNIIASGNEVSVQSALRSSSSFQLTQGQKYYWRVINNTGITSNVFEFTLTSNAYIDGRLNITVFDEQQSYNRIMIFNAQVYNSTTLLNKSTTNGWVNFSGSEISSGEYLIRIVPNSSYASRSVLATSPTDVIMYIPSTSNIINTIAFYLLDYTTMYPWSSSILTITKNNSIMYKSYFDADSKVGVYLIQGDTYGVTITNGNNIQNWGNYVPISSGNVQVVITGISVNATSTIPFIYNLSYSINDITLNWSSNVNINSLNFTILKNNTTPIHQLTTTIMNGQSSYTVTDTNSTYYVYITVDKDNGIYTKTEVINYRGGTPRTDCGLGLGCRFNIGTFIMPQWAYNNGSILFIWLIAGSFGAWFAALGAIIAIILLVLFVWWGWLEGAGIGISLVGAIAVLVIIDYLKSKE